MFKAKHNNGFTLIETLLVVGVLIILLSMSVVLLGPSQKQSDLQSSSQEIINALRRAQNRTLASENESTFGVFIDTISNPHQYILFQGVDYVNRVLALDEISSLPESIEFSVVNLGGGDEIVFDRVDGTTSQPGSITVRLKSPPSQTRIIYIDALGVIETSSTAAPSDSARVKDSRHVHVDYIGRPIDTATETMSLDFSPSPTVETITLADYISGGQFDWEGVIDVDGEMQELRIHTHKLNDVGFTTQFSIHRDRRVNTKPFTITLSGDITGDIIQYTATGITTQGTSIYVSTPPDWQ